MNTNNELLACIRRELGMRIAVYPRRVADKKMSQDKADHEIECCRQILAILEKQANDPQQKLFDDK